MLFSNLTSNAFSAISDFSPNTILIEIGGIENSIHEVMNTSTVLGNIISEVIKENEG